MNLSAPQAKAFSASLGLGVVEYTMTGMFENFGLLLICLSTANPSITGILISKKIHKGNFCVLLSTDKASTGL